MSRSLRDQRALLEAPSLLDAVVPTARLAAAALDHCDAEGYPSPYRQP